MSLWYPLGWVTHGSQTFSCSLTVSRWAEIDWIAPIDSVKAFVAMWFADEMTPIYRQGIQPAIEDVGYHAVRVDGVEHVGKIDDLIIAGIRESRFVVADFTGHRGGVYFEAGFALGLGCRSSGRAAKTTSRISTSTSASTTTLNCIDWDDANGLQSRLINRIRASVGSGGSSRSRAADTGLSGDMGGLRVKWAEASMLDKPLEQITLADLEELVREAIPEGKTLDYKRDLYGRNDPEKKELLKDASSFANTMGGDLIIGMDEANGIPTGIPGVTIANIDAEKLRLDETIRRGIEPRIDFAIHTIDTGIGTRVLLIRVRESWILPHRVVYHGQFGEFWARNSAGKYSMDTTELRQAFNLSETFYEKIKSFRQGRVAEILGGNSPIPMKDNAKLILHLIPLESVRSKVALNLHVSTEYPAKFPPIGHLATDGWSPRLNFDGFLSYSEARTPTAITTYVELFRNGIIEAALDSIHFESNGHAFLATSFYERNLLRNLSLYLEGYKWLSIRTPIWALLTLTGVKGVSILPPHGYVDIPFPIDRDILYLPEIVIEDPDQPVAELLRPAFDLIWNAAGLMRDLNFDAAGNFVAT